MPEHRRSAPRQSKTARAVFEALEPRLLLSADPLGVLMADALADSGDPGLAMDLGPDAAFDRLLEAPPESHGVAPVPLDLAVLIDLSTRGDAAASGAGDDAPRVLVFVDPRVPDYQALLADLAPGDTNLEVVLIDPQRDGVAQMDAALLRTGGPVEAVHVVSHASAEGVQLGGARLGEDTLGAYAQTLAGWSGVLTADADILFYGCDLAAGDAGRALLQSVAELTGADVAASDDATGAAGRGADWDLEFNLGQIDTTVVFSEDLQQQWQGQLATFTVVNTDDSGAGSLRQAIIDANTAAGADTIEFTIPGLGPHTVALTSDELPVITEQVTIDATTEPDYAGTPVIVLDGDALGGGKSGLTFNATADGSVVRGLVIGRFDDYGIHLLADNALIELNYLGTDVTGSLDWGNNRDGIRIEGSGNTISGNLISGNNDHGIFINGVVATANTVIGNRIGTDADGLASLGNNQEGIFIDSADNNTIGGNVPGEGNLISGNGWVGIDLKDASGTTLHGNLIGTDIKGTGSLGNADNGVEIWGSSTGTVIGGPGPGEGNVIAFNGNHGVELRSGINDVRFNEIYDNVNDEIHLNGGNSLADTPIVSNASSVAGNTSLTVAFSGANANTAYDIDLFANPTNEAEGQVFFGSFTLITDGSGNAFVGGMALGFEVANGHFITATATNAVDGTSAFSNGAPVVGPGSVNTAPALDPTVVVALNPIAANSGPPSGAVGTLVSSLIDLETPAGGLDNVADPDAGALTGIAVVAADTGNGTWHYSIDDGANWLALGAVSVDSARLLAADANTRLYFQPNAAYTGTVANGIHFRAWDQTTGANGATAYTIVHGGTSAYSLVFDTASITVAANIAPAAVADSYTVNEDTALDSNDGWFDTDWTLRRTLFFDNTDQGTNLSDFPVLVTLDSSRIDYNNTQDNGEDLRFVDGDGNVLSHEIEEWNESGDSYVWVKVPQIDASSSKDFIWMYYGNTGAADGQDVTGVWTSSYQGVYHLDETAGAHSDSSANGYSLSQSGGVTKSAAGQIDGADDFDGINDYLWRNAADANLEITGDVTLEAWVNIDSYPGGAFPYEGVIEFSGSGETSGENYLYAMILRPTGDIQLGHESGGGTDHFQDFDVNLATDQWYQLTAVRDATAKTWNLYMDGSAAGSYSYATNASGGTGAELYVGWDFAYFDGTIDEVRVSGIDRTADWVSAVYASESDDFITFGYEHGVAGVLGNDLDSDALTATLVSGPSNEAAFSLNANGTFTYTPALNFNGTDSFTYKANDGVADSNTVTVTITVDPVDDDPVFEQSGPYSVDENASVGTVVGDVDANDGDGSADPANLVFSELMYDPNSPENDWEWVEIYNPGAAGIDLAGWVLDDINADAHGAANIAAGFIGAGETAVFYNADAVSAVDFTAAWGQGLNLVAVTGWGNLPLNNVGGDQVALWQSFADYSGDHATHANAVVKLNFLQTGPWPVNNDAASIYLTDLAADPADGANWALSVAAGASPAGGTAATSTAAGTNTGGDVGSPNEPGTGAGVTYAITANVDPGGNGVDAFAIDAASGIITVNDPLDLDFEGTNPLVITVQAYDGGKQTSTSVTINLNDLSEAPVAADDAYAVNEDAVLTVPALTGLLNNDTDPDGNPVTARLVSGPANGTLTLTPAGATNAVNLSSHAASDKAPDWSPDGGRIVFVSDRGLGDNEIFVMDADGSNATNLSNDAGDDGAPAWSPDGSKILFHSNRSGNYEIYVMDADGSNVTNLSNDAALDKQASWSPDGSQIAFRSDRDGDGDEEIFVMDADGSNVTQLTSNTFSDRNPDWSPDGAQLTFTTNRDGNWEIYVMDADGSNAANVTNSAGTSDRASRWSPDGARVTFRSDTGGDREIFVVDTDGSNLIQITDNADEDLNPRWSPDGSRIVFESDRDGNFEVYTLDLLSDGAFVYTPDADFSGSDAFTYVANDGTAESAAATVTVTVNPLNDDPTLGSFAAAVDATAEDTEVQITLADLKAQGDEGDVDGTVDGFVVKAVTSGTLKIGATSGSAAAWDAVTNNTVDASNHAYWTPAGNVNGNGFNAFTAVALDDAGAESTTARQATVNVSSVADKTLWLKADAGVTIDVGGVRQWDNQASGNSLADVRQAVDSRRPEFSASALNFNPVISFDTANLDFLMDTSVLASDLVGSDSASIFAVVRVNNPGGVVFQWQTADDNRFSFEKWSGNQRFDFGDGNVDRVVGSPMGPEYQILNVQANPGNPANMQIFVNGQLDAQGNASSANPLDPGLVGQFKLGGWVGGDLANANVDMAEILVYDADLNAAERQRIDSYLAVKYGVTLDQATVTNYTDSSGNVIWDAGANAAYGNDIAGIGRDNVAALNQAQSRSINSDSILTVSGASSQDDGDFLLWGNDNGALTETGAGTPAGIDLLLQRTWKVAETGELGTTTLTFDLNSLAVSGTVAGDFHLIVDSDTDFSSGATLVAASSYVGGVVTFNGVDLADGQFFTVGTDANDAPSIANATLTAVDEDTTNPSGNTVTGLFGATFSDPNPGAALAGVAVVGNPEISAEGQWQYSTDGSNWIAVGPVGDDADALVLSAATEVRFVPAADYSGTPTGLTVRALDNTYAGGYSDTTGGTETPVTVDASVNGDPTPLGDSVATLGTGINPVNDIPTLGGFAAAVDATAEDTGVEITLADLKAQGDEGDVDGTVDGFVIKAVSSGTLTIGATSGTATAWDAVTNNTVDAANHAYWTPAGNANGNGLNAFTAVAVDDDGAESATARQATVNVGAVNDDPTGNGAGLTTTNLNDNAGASKLFADLAVSDVDAGESDLVLKITLSDPAAGTINGGGFTHQGGGVYTRTGLTVAQADNALDVVKFTPTDDTGPAGSFTTDISVTVDDQGGGGDQSLLGPTTLTISRINDGPAGAIGNVTVNEDAPDTVLNLAGLFSDPDEASSDLVYAVTGNTNGALVATAVDLAADTLTLGYAADSTGIADVTVRATDATGKFAESTFRVQVNAQSDAPILGNNSLAVTEGESVILSPADLSASDLDDPDGGLTFTVAGVSGGRFELVSNPGVSIGSFTQDQVSAGLVRFVHDGGDAAPSYTVSVSDGNSVVGPVAAHVDFTPVGAPPPEPAPVPGPVAEPPPDPDPDPPPGEGGSTEPPTTEEEVEEQATEAEPVKETPPDDLPVDDASPVDEVRADLGPEREGAQGPGTVRTLEAIMRNMLVRNPYIDVLLGAGEESADLQAVPLTLTDFNMAEVSGFVRELDGLREDMASGARLEQVVVGSTVAATTGLSIGYVVWLVRGGVLLSSVLSSLPAWQFIDPLPVLGSMAVRPEDEEDDESLESMVKEKPEPADVRNMQDESG